MFKKLFQKSQQPQFKNQIELCVSNRIYDSEEIDTLLNREDIELNEVGCNSQCEVCDIGYYAIVNGEVLCADSAPELLEKIDEELEQNSIIY
ncbi:DUF1450 domain-containing protein [Psychrobacillus sp. NEAU-3TGS]|uniref:DUF1450 domain-containing protein n=1 Tax=Psychrobacillus sp. NEAU-3TGS TaxID=2995412 RepID=UPI0024964EFE|nr:DUF1450 domain-containing protein [Psychrobacillus sp. NEAU-3TGS]MDI2588415.1 DUF1450 domain-containing protein [Psychrobacillus sp. NEAU-3TGS]